MGRGDDDEWVVVRSSRRRATSQTAFQQLVDSNRLKIPVVALHFNAIRPDDPDEVRAKEKKKAQRKRNKANRKAAAAAQDDDEDDDDDDDEDEDDEDEAPATSSSAPTNRQAPSKQTIVSKAAGTKPPPSEGWLYKLLCAWLLWIQALLGLSKTRKKLKPPKPTAAAAATPTKPTTTSTAKATPATQQQSTANSTAPTPPTQPAVAPTPTAPTSKPAAPAPSASAARTHTPSTTTSSTVPTTTPSTDTISQPRPKPNAASATPASQARAATATAAAAPPPKTGPASKCDRDWSRGRFWLSVVPGAHSDVLSSVALAGNLALSCGHDGALKMWTVRPGSTPRRAGSLNGHTGRVEAVVAHAAGGRAASSGRDSSLKVWNLGRGGEGAKELASYYVYESIRRMAARWDAGASVAALGARSGNTSVYTLENGRKQAVLKGHQDEVTALLWAGDQALGEGNAIGGGGGGGDGILLSGGGDGCVFGWDLRAPGPQGAAQLFSLEASRSKVSSLSTSQHYLLVGDSSTTVKIYDLRMARDGLVDLSSTKSKVPNAPMFAGSPCPSVVAYHQPAGVLLSSSVAWWEEDEKVLREAPDDVDVPASVLNVTALDGDQHQYVYSVRLGPGVITTMAIQGDMVLAGTTTGSLALLTLARGATNRMSTEDHDAQVVESLPVGVEEHSDDEDNEEEE